MRTPVVLTGLITFWLLTFSLSFAQTSSQLAPLASEKTDDSQSVPRTDSGLSGANTTGTVPDASSSQDLQSQGIGRSAGRTKPTASPGATASTTYVFPTSGQMNRYWLRNTIGLEAFVGATFTASWRQWISDSPSDWAKDATGFGQRYGTAFLDNAINTTSLVWISRAMGQDPRYRRCDCTGLWPRTGHAIKLAFMSYNRNGSLVFSPAKIVQPFTGPLVTRNTIYPDRFGTSDAFSGGGYYFAGSVAWNWVREFIWKKW